VGPRLIRAAASTDRRPESYANGADATIVTGGGIPMEPEHEAQVRAVSNRLLDKKQRRDRASRACELRRRSHPKWDGGKFILA
jgi:hypothetical protein